MTNFGTGAKYNTDQYIGWHWVITNFDYLMVRSFVIPQQFTCHFTVKYFYCYIACPQRIPSNSGYPKKYGLKKTPLIIKNIIETTNIKTSLAIGALQRRMTAKLVNIELDRIRKEAAVA
jgi:hypothetical protein